MRWKKHCGCNISLQKLYNHLNLLYDNQAAIAIMYGNQQHAVTKHFDIQLYFLCDTIENSQITIQYLPTDQMLADILTKGLPGPKVKSLVNKLCIY